LELSTHFAKKIRFFSRFFARKRIYVELFAIFCQMFSAFLISPFNAPCGAVYKVTYYGKTNKKERGC